MVSCAGADSLVWCHNRRRFLPAAAAVQLSLSRTVTAKSSSIDHIPVAKIDPSMLSWFAKRLNKWFGFDRRSFVAVADVETGGEGFSSAENDKKDVSAVAQAKESKD